MYIVRSLAPLVMLNALCGCGSDVTSASDGPVADALHRDASVDATVDGPVATCVPTCGSHATCDGAQCVCDEGFQGDGLSCQPYWKLVASYPFDIAPLPFPDSSPNFWPHVTGHQHSIFIGVQSSMTLTYPGWRSIDLSTSPPTLSPPLTLPPQYANSNEFCACGNNAHVASDGARYIYMFGNNAQRYEVVANQWTRNTTTYDPVRRGESPQVFVPADQSVLFFGGRGNPVPLDTVLRYSVVTDGFTIEPTPMPAPLTHAVAWLPLGGSTIYVAGGDHDGLSISTMPHDRIISRPTTSSVWTVHPDAPGDLRYPAGMGDYHGRIWVAARSYAFHPEGVDSLPSKAYFFNPATNTWDRSVFLPTSTLAAVTADGETWALARTETAGVAGFDLYKLVAIDETPEP